MSGLAESGGCSLRVDGLPQGGPSQFLGPSRISSGYVTLRSHLTSVSLNLSPVRELSDTCFEELGVLNELMCIKCLGQDLGRSGLVVKYVPFSFPYFRTVHAYNLLVPLPHQV